MTVRRVQTSELSQVVKLYNRLTATADWCNAEKAAWTLVSVQNLLSNTDVRIDVNVAEGRLSGFMVWRPDPPSVHGFCIDPSLDTASARRALFELMLSILQEVKAEGKYSEILGVRKDMARGPRFSELLQPVTETRTIIRSTEDAKTGELKHTVTRWPVAETLTAINAALSG